MRKILCFTLLCILLLCGCESSPMDSIDTESIDYTNFHNMTNYDANQLQVYL